ncbi:MAG: XRE family transcriptional regulator [Bacteroidetes bacterium]|uniref:Helix-turn-helix transcriptional regulator n=1 Tax=Phaeocystidibacter marisrubri TaxID=1577780 RepID=A0A6L3ZEU2_9FLAO|nr:helix-turn-helix transcriptional regulator [Phaeocystidibacter marisrubri]KAB2816313.1 helix-turn-helix transcriptional regulator [Phaeocystidibacter marisrubri]TNE30244.1 MAG: XRE family transcriptional regulator [Bacteroidota bacterium]GGH68403.1 hypothetical protein GCM10011318_08390 [Phaeocystidibacter marisrubri]
MHLTEITKALVEKRKILGITQERLALITGISARTIKELERGKGNPSFDTLFKIADTLGMEIRVETKLPNH